MMPQIQDGEYLKAKKKKNTYKDWLTSRAFNILLYIFLRVYYCTLIYSFCCLKISLNFSNPSLKKNLFFCFYNHHSLQEVSTHFFTSIMT